MQNLRWKVIICLAVLAIFGAVGIYPIVAARSGINSPSWLMNQQLKLGLDLRGGVHLVLGVMTEEALQHETEAEAERMREAIRTAGITAATVTVDSSTQFKVEGVPREQDAGFRQTAVAAETNFDRTPGGAGSYTFVMRPNVQVRLREEAVTQARQTIERRVDELGVAEPIIAQQGANGDQILVQLPGVSDINRAKQIIQATGILQLKIVEQGPVASRESLLVNGQVPLGMEIVPGSSGAPGDASTVYYLVKRAAAVEGRDLRSARPGIDSNGRPAVNFTLNSDGARKFGEVTGANVGRQLAIILDNRVHSAPTINQRINADGIIEGAFTQQDVQDLSLVLRSGSLGASLIYLQEQVIGPTLGAESIRAGVTASLAGLLLVVSFMLIYYKLSGVNAVTALAFNLVILLGMMAYVGAVMTLPGIAGFILTIGIGVDSNVLIFERIKEELETGKGVRAAVNAGFSRVWWTLLDTHIAALIAAAFLFQFGTGAIRGFAVTLTFGLLSNLFTSTFVSKTLFEVILARRHQTVALSI
jgi:preprotein translocase subunit SecD